MISLILPVHNEHRNMKDNFLKIYKAVKDLGPFEIIIAEDGSTDDTLLLAKRYARMKNVRLMSHAGRIGKGKAIKNGVAAAKGSVIGFMDVDLSVPLGYLGAAVESVSDGEQFVIGNRYARGSKRSRKFGRLAESILYNALMVLLFGSKVKDHQCGFKFWASGFIKKYARMVNDNSWFFDSELIVRAERSGILPYEMPVDWKEGSTSNVSPSTALYLFISMLRFRLRG